MEGDWNENHTQGRWRSPNLWGGCHNDGNRDYINNPRIRFSLPSFEVVNFALQLPQDSEVKGIGFYIFEYSATPPTRSRHFLTLLTRLYYIFIDFMNVSEYL